MARLKLYGCTWPEGAMRHQVEGYCWANYDNLQIKDEVRWKHLKNYVMLIDEEMRKGWNDWTELMCWAYGTYNYVAALGCTTSTKTHTFHKFAFYDYMAKPEKTMVSCCTTNSVGLERRMWPVMNATFNYVKKTGMIPYWEKNVSPNKLIKYEKGQSKCVIRALTIQPKADDKEMVDQLIGVHDERVIVLVDEATSAPQAIVKAWPNAMANTTHRRLIQLGNPSDQADSLAQFCRPSAGWDSVNEDTETWEFDFYGEKGIGLHFHGKNSPNIKRGKLANGKDRWPFLFTQETFDLISAEKDRNPDQYYRMLVGWFAPEGVSRRVCSMAMIDRHKCREKATFRGGDIEYFAALDPAFGGDKCILMILKKGYEVTKKKVIMEIVEKCAIPIDPRNLPGEQIGKYVVEKKAKWKFKRIFLDTTTNNSAPAEWLERNSDLKVDWITFGGAASNDRNVSPQDDRLACDAYYNKAAELAFGVSNNLDIIHGLDEETILQIVSRYWEPIGDKPTRQKIEGKSIFKERMHCSPDSGDALSLAVEGFRRLGGLELTKNNNSSKNWSAIARKKARIWNSEAAYSE